jgi:hypothetical protein
MNLRDGFPSEYLREMMALQLPKISTYKWIHILLRLLPIALQLVVSRFN